MLWWLHKSGLLMTSNRGRFWVMKKISGNSQNYWKSLKLKVAPENPPKSRILFSEETASAVWPCCHEVWKVLVTQLCLTLCDPTDYSLPGSSVHGILQARILEWVAIPFPRRSYRPRDRTRSPTLQADSLSSEPPGINRRFLFFLRAPKSNSDVDISDQYARC